MMIDDLRKNVSKKNVVAIILFGAIIIVFVFFGFIGKGQRGGGGVGYAARVNDRTITIADFQNSLAQMTKQYAPLFGDQLEKNPEIQMRIRNSALDQLIQREIVSQGAFKEGFLVTNAEIRDFITKVPAFQKDGVFQRAYYDGYLENVHTTASHFEDQLKRDMAIDQLRHAVAGGFTPFDSEVDKIQKLKSKMYTMDYVKFDSEDFKKKTAISDADITEFLNSKENQMRVQLDLEKANKDSKAKIKSDEKAVARKIIAEDRTEKMSQELGMKIKNTAEFEGAMGKLGLKWQTTKPFSMDQDHIPEIGSSEKLMNQVFKLTKKGELVPEVFTTSQGTFAIRLNKIEDKPVTGDLEAVKAQVGSQRANETFNKWSDAMAKGYSIEKNSDLLRVSTAQESAE